MMLHFVAAGLLSHSQSACLKTRSTDTLRAPQAGYESCRRVEVVREPDRNIP